MKVLVTGANGFVGNYVVEKLLGNNHTVIASSLDINSGKRYKWFDKVIRKELNIEELVDNCYKYFEEPDLLIHLAWVGLPNYKDLFHFEKNLFFSYFFLKNMIAYGLKSLSVIGTCFEYGMQNGCLNEEMETRPSNSYGLAKDTLRKFIVELSKEYNFDYKWIRLFYLYGEGQNENSILELLKKALENNDDVFNMSGGEQLRDYLPVEKAAEFIVKLSTHNKENGIFNCCSGEPISIRNLVGNYLKKNRKSINLNIGYYPYPEYEPMAFWGDNKKLKLMIEAQDESRN